MKTIGRTNEGNVLVEMTDGEHRIFKELEVAARGTTLGAMMGSDLRHMNIDSDLEKTFSVIRAFTDGRFRVNSLRDMIDNFEEMFMEVNHV